MMLYIPASYIIYYNPILEYGAYVLYKSEHLYNTYIYIYIVLLEIKHVCGTILNQRFKRQRHVIQYECRLYYTGIL